MIDKWFLVCLIVLVAITVISLVAFPTKVRVTDDGSNLARKYFMMKNLGVLP